MSTRVGFAVQRESLWYNRHGNCVGNCRYALFPFESVLFTNQSVQCPMHNWSFNLETGQCDKSIFVLDIYNVKEQDGQVWVCTTASNESKLVKRRPKKAAPTGWRSKGLKRRRGVYKFVTTPPKRSCVLSTHTYACSHLPKSFLSRLNRTSFITCDISPCACSIVVFTASLVSFESWDSSFFFSPIIKLPILPLWASWVSACSSFSPKSWIAPEK